MEQLEDLASPVAAFIRDWCKTGPGKHENTRVVWGAWKACCDLNGDKPGSDAMFGRNLRAALPSLKKKGRANRTRRYWGVQLNDYGRRRVSKPLRNSPELASKSPLFRLLKSTSSKSSPIISQNNVNSLVSPGAPRSSRRTGAEEAFQLRPRTREAAQAYAPSDRADQPHHRSLARVPLWEVGAEEVKPGRVCRANASTPPTDNHAPCFRAAIRDDKHKRALLPASELFQERPLVEVHCPT